MERKLTYLNRRLVLVLVDFCGMPILTCEVSCKVRTVSSRYRRNKIGTWVSVFGIAAMNVISRS
jgi:hypothetical protein